MKKVIGLIATSLFFASVTVFQIPLMQNDTNNDLTLSEKVTIMANAGDGENGDEDEKCPGGYCKHSWNGTWCEACCPEEKDPRCNNVGCTCR